MIKLSLLLVYKFTKSVYHLGQFQKLKIKMAEPFAGLEHDKITGTGSECNRPIQLVYISILSRKKKNQNVTGPKLFPKQSKLSVLVYTNWIIILRPVSSDLHIAPSQRDVPVISIFLKCPICGMLILYNSILTHTNWILNFETGFVCF